MCTCVCLCSSFSSPRIFISFIFSTCDLQAKSQFSSVQFSRSVVTLCGPMNCQASLSITNSRSLLKLMPIESVMPSSHLIFCHPLLLLPPIPPSIRVFPSESTLCMRWPKYWSFSPRSSLFFHC